MRVSATPRLLLAFCSVLLLVFVTALATVDARRRSDPAPATGDGPERATFRLPYLQSLAADSVLIAWKTGDTDEPWVDFGLTNDFGTSVRATRDGVRRVAALRNLRPGTRYVYRVRAGSRVLAEGPQFSFRTDEGPADRSFSFFVTGDIGTKKGKQALTAKDILACRPRPELGILVGDIVYKKGRSEHYDRRLMRPWSGLLSTIPVWPALGNHDWKSDPSDNFEQEWYLPHNEHYYSFDYANAHFIALDTRDGDIYDLRRQVRWLEKDLEANQNAPWKFAYFHHPGITCTYKGNHDRIIDHFLPLFDRYNVDVVFNGHAHTYERLYPLRDGRPLHRDQDPHYRDPEGTLYIISGAGGKVKKNHPTQLCGPTAFFRDETILWTQVQIDGPRCTIRTYRSSDHALIDEVTITKSRLASGATNEP